MRVVVVVEGGCWVDLRRGEGVGEAGWEELGV